MAAKSDLTLVIGNKAYSSWSLRPWLLLRESGIPFQEILIPLYQPDSPRRIRERSPSGRVPALIDGATTIWDSLAICEYVAERFPEARGWPEDGVARAIARSVSAEMHSGFASVRTEMPMNVRGRRSGVTPSPAARNEIDRILEIWSDCRRRFGASGKFLFGRFGIADAMYAPVVTRFHTYGIELTGAARDYSEAVQALASLQEWSKAGRAEPAVITASERGTPVA
ncbi:MAG TPA: glutathione S-transferase family protein [Myxococcota bacterium]|jgi:glutathione S-transferase